MSRKSRSSIKGDHLSHVDDTRQRTNRATKDGERESDSNVRLDIGEVVVASAWEKKNLLVDPPTIDEGTTSTSLSDPTEVQSEISQKGRARNAAKERNERYLWR